nr:hypothetical protein Iba_chr11aCG10320 [Ipomoea batatas]
MAPPNHAVTTLAPLATLTHVADAVISSISLGFAWFASAAPNTIANDTVPLVFASATSCGQLLTDHVGASSRPPHQRQGANQILTSLCHNKSVSPPNSSTENVSSPISAL